VIALERQNNHKKHTFKGPGIQKSPENRLTYILPRPERGIRIRKAGRIRILATALALQAPIQVFAYDRISRVDNNNAAIVASAGVHYSSIAQEEVAPEPKSPSLATINTSPQPEMSPAEPKNVELSKCINEWETLSSGVCFTKLREYGSDVYAVRVDLKNPKVSVRPSFVEGPGRLGRLSDAVERLDAKAAINASFFKGTSALGPIAADGKWIHTDPSHQEVFIVKKDNTVKIMPTTQALKENPAQMKFAVSGSHTLIQNGINTDDFGPDNRDCILNCVHPRTAIGVDKNGYFYMIAVDGKSQKSRGVTMPELETVLLRMGILDAIALDGGRSTGFYAKSDNEKGKIRNNPSKGEQKIATAVVVTANR
jgi:hypothetical protein